MLQSFLINLYLPRLDHQVDARPIFYFLWIMASFIWSKLNIPHIHLIPNSLASDLDLYSLDHFIPSGELLHYLREFLSDKAKNLLNKEGPGLPIEAAPALPPQQDRVIHVISGGSEVSGISSGVAKRSTHKARNGQEAEGPKHLLLGINEISFTAREQ